MSDSPPPSSRPADPRDDALAVVRRLRDAGHVAYFAGGCVRDALLGLTPKDYDVATDAPPERVRGLFPRTQAVGAAFGVILVRQGRSQVEVATFRADGKYADGRRPEHVTFTTAEEDAKRRDFTINGLFYDPLDDKVIDYVGGRPDLQAKVLRTIGEPDDRFQEDHLRMLRAVRFAARFHLAIAPTTAAAIAARAEHLKRISPERVADELRLMLTPTTRAAAWDHLWSLGLVGVIFRRTNVAPPAQRVPNRCLFRHFDVRRPIAFGPALALATLTYLWQASAEPLDRVLLRLGLDHRRVLRETLKIANEDDAAAAEMWAGLFNMLRDLENVAAQKRFLGWKTAEPTRELARTVSMLGHYAERLTRIEAQLAEHAHTDFAPPPLITGDDLAAAGLRPGPAFKSALDAAYDGQLEGRVTSKAEALDLAMRAARGA